MCIYRYVCHYNVLICNVNTSSKSKLIKVYTYIIRKQFETNNYVILEKEYNQIASTLFSTNVIIQGISVDRLLILQAIAGIIVFSCYHLVIRDDETLRSCIQQI